MSKRLSVVHTQTLGLLVVCVLPVSFIAQCFQQFYVEGIFNSSIEWKFLRFYVNFFRPAQKRNTSDTQKQKQQTSNNNKRKKEKEPATAAQDEEKMKLFGMEINLCGFQQCVVAM